MGKLDFLVKGLKKKGYTYFDYDNEVLVFKSSNFRQIAESIKTVTDLWKCIEFKVMRIENKAGNFEYKVKYYLEGVLENERKE